MIRRIEPIAVAERRGVYTLTHGKAKAVIKPVGDEVAVFSLSGSESPRSWWMLAARLAGAAQRLGVMGIWDAALRSDEMPQGACATGISHTVARGGCDVFVVDNSGNDADAEIRIAARGSLSLSVKADGVAMDADQMVRLGALLIGVAQRLIQGPMGLLSVDLVRKAVADVCRMGGE